MCAIEVVNFPQGAINCTVGTDLGCESSCDNNMLKKKVNYSVSTYHKELYLYFKKIYAL